MAISCGDGKGPLRLLWDYGHPTTTGAQMAANAPHLPVRILIVDDHVDSAAACRGSSGTRATALSRPHRGGCVALLAGQPPVQLVVSDVGLPDGDGCELLGAFAPFMAVAICPPSP